MRLQVVVGLGVLATLSSSCLETAQEGRLFRQDAPAVSKLHIASAAAPSTDAFAELADGATCRGRISRTDAADMALSPDSESSATSDGAVGVLICSSNLVLRCRLVHRHAESYAYGECADQRGVKYTVVF